MLDKFPFMGSSAVGLFAFNQSCLAYILIQYENERTKTLRNGCPDLELNLSPMHNIKTLI